MIIASSHHVSHVPLLLHRWLVLLKLSLYSAGELTRYTSVFKSQVRYVFAYVVLYVEGKGSQWLLGLILPPWASSTQFWQETTVNNLQVTQSKSLMKLWKPSKSITPSLFEIRGGSKDPELKKHLEEAKRAASAIFSCEHIILVCSLELSFLSMLL